MIKSNLQSQIIKKSVFINEMLNTIFTQKLQ